jgi:hypothetical protein
MPLIKAAARVIGTGRIKRMLAEPLAAFIAPFVGSQAARALAPHIAGAGMKLLGLEREDPATLGTEALFPGSPGLPTAKCSWSAGAWPAAGRRRRTGRGRTATRRPR